jgi:hypothetical protein
MVPMTRLGKKLSSTVIALLASASLLAGCGGGGSHVSAVPQAQPTTSSSAAYTGPLSDATFKITIPVPTTSAKARRPAYVSSSTTKIVFTLNSDTVGLTGAALTTFNTTNLGAKAVTLNSATCPGTGPWTCTLTIKLPPGTDNVTVSAQDGSSNILSQQISSFNVVVATANSFSITLDANANTMTISATSGFCAGSFNVSSGGSVPTVGTSPLTFNASYTDLAGKTIIAPGRPILSVNGHTDDNAGSGYTITGTGGNVTVKVTQSTQSYTLAATNTSTTATINVAATPANTNGSPTDGLGFNKTLSYTFQSGPAPPSSFLAVIEQTGTNAGKIDLFTVSLGATDSFSAFSPATLAVQPPPVGSNAQNSDVDFPQDLLFDPNGDLLIANGGGSVSGVDFGNFACVPAGAITTGNNVATVLTTNMDDPEHLALGTDSTVAVSNVPASAGVKVEEFELSGTYTPDSGTRNITNATYPGLGTAGVIALPATGTNPSGSFASSITNGTTVSHIVIKRPDGTSTQIDNTHIVAPELAYDSFNDQIAAASNNGTSSWLNFVNPTTFAVVKQFTMHDDGCYSAGAWNNCPPGGAATPTHVSDMKASVTAASSSGYVAVGGITASGEPEVQVYNPSHDPTGGPIPYDATTTPGGPTFVYGNATIIVHALRFITGTKLLVSLESDDGVHQGIYTYDVTTLVSPCTCYDFNANQFANSPKQTGFHALTNIPLSVAYKP